MDFWITMVLMGFCIIKFFLVNKKIRGLEREIDELKENNNA